MSDAASMPFVYEPDESGLVYAWRLDGRGGGERVGWEGIAGWSAGDGPLWIHLDPSRERARSWLNEQAGVPGWVADALTGRSSRPRTVVCDDGLLVLFRGVNYNPAYDPADMVQLRLWADAARVVSFRTHRTVAAVHLRESIEVGRGPGTTAELLAFMAEDLTLRAEEAVEQLEELADDAEDSVDRGMPARRLGEMLSDLRRRTARFRRYLVPQREAVAQLRMAPVSWLDDPQRLRFRETADRITRIVEDLDAIRESASVTNDELAAAQNERQNARLYVLSIVTAIFLPLSLVTGALGMNVGGLPWVASPSGFWLVCGVMAVCAVVLGVLLRLLRWI